MDKPLEVLSKYKEQILLAEVGVWLHLLGKFSSKFFKDQLEGHAKRYKGFYKQLNPVFRDLYGNSWPESHWRIPSLTGVQWPQSFTQFSEKHDDPRFARGKSPIALAADAHGRGSGTDKSVQAIYNGQEPPICLATAFGCETSIDDTRLDASRDELYRFIAAMLEQIKTRLPNSENLNWAKMLPTFVERLWKNFSITVGDTRRPINDVSLWDQTSATVAFFKPALAKNVLLGSWQNPLEQKYKWRFLHVALDGLSYWGSANRIGDLRARQELVTSALDAVKELLEISYPLGVEVYRDETGTLFLVPDEPSELLKLMDENGSTLEELIYRKVIAVFDGEMSIDLQLDDRATRNLFRAGRLLSQPLLPVSAESDKLRGWWSRTTEQEGRALCSICALRPQGFGAQNPSEMRTALERGMCCICMRRLAGQAGRWVKKLERTIWIDEVSDSGARVALMVGQFDLEHWLNGIYLSSMTIPDPSDVDKQGQSFRELMEEVKDGLEQKASPTDESKCPILSRFLKKNVRNLGSCKDLNDFLVQEEDLAAIAGEIEPYERLFLALVRKPPSFARIRRVWETTKRFWETIRDESIPCQLDTRQRIEFVGTFTPVPGESLQSHQAYELVIGEYRVPVFCKNIEGDQDQFLTIDSLEYVPKHLRLDDVQQMLKENIAYTLELPGGYDMRRRKLGTVTISEVKLASQSYRPHIPILAEPRTFMALVPADKAMDIAQAIKEKYEREMGKVRNRLSLHLGLVFFPRKTPLRTVLEAGRGMLEGFSKLDAKEQMAWTVQDICTFNEHLPEAFENDPHFSQGRAIALERDGRRIIWYVPLMMGDGNTDDAWYPYVFIKEPGEGTATPKDRTLAFAGIRPLGHGKTGSSWLVHAKELCIGDRVYFTPSYFDFEFLDTNARRFEVSYRDGKRRATYKRNRPYLLDDLERLTGLWERIADNLTTVQIKQLDGLIEAKRQQWKQGTGQKEYGKTFKQFVHDVLANVGWKKRPCEGEMEKLELAALTGELHDVLELYMDVLKRKPGGAVKREVKRNHEL